MSRARSPANPSPCPIGFHGRPAWRFEGVKGHVIRAHFQVAGTDTKAAFGALFEARSQPAK